jgi:2-dehydro-3-deoxygluconokinase
MTAGCFLAIGECMVEMAPADDGRYAMGFAGDTFNTAWYARRALPPGVEVAYLTAVGSDETSRRMLAFMRGAGVIPEVAEMPDRTVGLYLITLSDGERSFSYWRETSAARHLARGLERLPRVTGAGDVAYFSGITLAILSPDDRETLLACLAEARRAGVTVAFDPNLRPRLWRDTEEMCAWVMQGAAVADIALPSFEDDTTYFGDVSPAATADRYRAAGVATVIVKNGAGPVHGVADDGRAVEVDPVPVDLIVDTTAAGDSFNAAALAGLMAGEPLEAAIGSGCRLAAHVVTRRGALVE